MSKNQSVGRDTYHLFILELVAEDNQLLLHTVEGADQHLLPK